MEMKKQLLEEINRMKVLGGMINEVSSPSSILAQLVSKFTKTALDDTILAAFEVLERKGVISIDKISKTLTKVDWQKLADDEMKLLFTAPPLRAALEEVTKKAGVDITSSAQKVAFKGGFKKIVKGYDDAAGSLISGGASKNTTSSLNPFGTKKPNLLSPLDFSKSSLEEIEKTLEKFRTGYPEFIPFEQQVNLVPGFSENAKNYVKMNFLTKSDDVIKQLTNARAELTGARFGPLAKVVTSILKNPKKTAVWTLSALFAYYLIKTGLKSFNIADKATNTGLNYIDKKLNGANSSGINPSKDSIIVQPNNTEDPLEILPKKGGGN